MVGPAESFTLFCLPHAGGGASLFREWQKQLPPSVRVCPIHLPGRESEIHLPAFTRLGPLVDALIHDLKPHLGRPYAFFGHSMGGLIAFELTRALKERLDSLPRRLFISSLPAPQLPRRKPPIHDLPRSLFLKELRRFRGIPQELLDCDELLEMVMPTLRADFALCESYRYVPAEALSCSLSVYGGARDRNVRLSELAPWQKQTSADFNLRVYPGDHFYLTSEQNRLLVDLAHDLTSAPKSHRPRMTSLH